MVIGAIGAWSKLLYMNRAMIDVLPTDMSPRNTILYLDGRNKFDTLINTAARIKNIYTSITPIFVDQANNGITRWLSNAPPPPEYKAPLGVLTWRPNIKPRALYLGEGYM